MRWETTMTTDELKLFCVTIECDGWVIAKSADDAEKILSASDGRDVLNDDVRHNATVIARVATGAEYGALPWRADGAEDADDATVTEWARRTKEIVSREKHEAKMAKAQTALPIE